jgi:hypothetical protein
LDVSSLLGAQPAEPEGGPWGRHYSCPDRASGRTVDMAGNTGPASGPAVRRWWSGGPGLERSGGLAGRDCGCPGPSPFDVLRRRACAFQNAKRAHFAPGSAPRKAQQQRHHPSRPHGRLSGPARATGSPGGGDLSGPPGRVPGGPPLLRGSGRPPASSPFGHIRGRKARSAIVHVCA